MHTLTQVGLVRHFPVQHPFLKGLVSQAQVLQWFEGYNQASVQQMQLKVGNTWDICYTSQLRRAHDTATAIYSGPTVSTELLNEPFPDPLFKGNPRLPFLLWATLVRLSIVFNFNSQSQRQSVLERRINKFLSQLSGQNGSRVLVVSHAFTMEIMSRLLVRAGFSGKKLNRPQHGVLYVFEKKS
ncbi:phosphoglycerate mutase family protein [Pontibacter sp. MBLB2868]|uniref:phosphoglycerate mutase family protein n=1 Tax=Pontibacter sp. MBLB2868 TaxID=3451555 RepID=UPI003F75082C